MKTSFFMPFPAIEITKLPNTKAPKNYFLTWILSPIASDCKAAQVKAMIQRTLISKGASPTNNC